MADRDSRSEENPENRFLPVMARIAREAVLRQWVEDGLQSLGEGKFDAQLLERFRHCRMEGRIALVTGYAYGEIPIGQRYDTAFVMSNPEVWETVNLAIEHVVWEMGVPMARTMKGHKHGLVLRMEGGLGRVLGALPEMETLALPAQLGDVGLCSSGDFEAVRAGLASRPYKF